MCYCASTTDTVSCACSCAVAYRSTRYGIGMHYLLLFVGEAKVGKENFLVLWQAFHKYLVSTHVLLYGFV